MTDLPPYSLFSMGNRYPISTNGCLLIISPFASEHSNLLKQEPCASKCPRSEIFPVYKNWNQNLAKLLALIDDVPGCRALANRLSYKQWVFAEGVFVLMEDAAHVFPGHLASNFIVYPASLRSRRILIHGTLMPSVVAYHSLTTNRTGLNFI